mmetsp:Transcript_73835/g.167324  ORF Transcript_73835/g.167324 Transcript_73835/m.167324 type:complete len:221 (+) Transcript_73835:720-1382(+)
MDFMEVPNSEYGFVLPSGPLVESPVSVGAPTTGSSSSSRNMSTYISSTPPVAVGRAMKEKVPLATKKRLKGRSCMWKMSSPLWNSAFWRYTATMQGRRGGTCVMVSQHLMNLFVTSFPPKSVSGMREMSHLGSCLPVISSFASFGLKSLPVAHSRVRHVTSSFILREVSRESSVCAQKASMIRTCAETASCIRSELVTVLMTWLMMQPLTTAPMIMVHAT